MNYGTDQLKEKIGGFHPELAKNGVSLTVDWDAAGKRFALKLSKAGKQVGAYLDQKDADECMSGKKCLNLAVVVTQLLAELEDLITPRKPG
jgi:5S rRNA maturation endonuclease (ribonuclease M5)